MAISIRREGYSSSCSMQPYPFHPRWKSSATSTSKARGFDLRDNLYPQISFYIDNQVTMLTNPVMTFQYYLLRLIPVAVLHRTLQIRAMMPVKILEYPVLILQSTEVCPFRWLCRCILYSS